MEKSILIGRPLRTIHAGMIRQRFDIVDNEQLSQFFNLLAAKTIDYAGFGGVVLDKTNNVTVGGFCFLSYFIVEVRPVE